MKFSAKNKIIILFLGWAVLIFAMFGYFFKIMDNSNQKTLLAMAQDRNNLAVLQKEDQNYKRAQADLKQLAEETDHPEDFFSKDINFLNELNQLQDLSAKYNVGMQLAGISGTTQTAIKAPTATPIVIIPYHMTISGSLPQLVGFIENLEHTSFITSVTNIAISSSADYASNQISASLTANFYLKK